MAKQVGIDRDGRTLRRNRAANRLEWDDWSQKEREIYAAAFLFPSPVEPLIDGITINGVEMKLAKLSRTATIFDEATNAVWRVIEHGRPENLG